MAAIAISAPGTDYGPCEPTQGANGVQLNCGHVDCRASRQQAAALCAGCSRPIGYETYWWYVDDRPRHRACTKVMA